MTSPFHAVARGLRLTLVGFLLTCCGAGVAVVLGWIWGQTYYADTALRVIFLSAMWTAIVTGVVGVVIGFVGRVGCLKMPPEFPAVRGRAIAAIILEASGWLSGFVGVGVMFAMGFGLLPQAFWVPTIGLILSVLLLLGGRVLFLRFLALLARVVDDATAARQARLSLSLFLTDWGLGLAGVGAVAGMSAINLYQDSRLVAYPIWIVAGVSGLAGLILYDRLLGGLARSVQAFAETHQDEEENQYRSRTGEDDRETESTMVE